MLTRTQMLQGRYLRRAMPSLKQQYHEYILQRVEAYKNSLTRDELLSLGDEAADELHAGAEGQFVLTEILMLETVDRRIERRLRLPKYARWRKQFAALRAAQREPVHWGISPASALVRLLPRLEADDQALVIGGGLQAEACLLAAFDTAVTFVDEDLATVEQLEARMAGESLSSRFHAYVASLGDWLPPFGDTVDLVVVDAGTLARLSYTRRHTLLGQARAITTPGGVHVLLPGTEAATPEAYVSHYPDWLRDWAPVSGQPGVSRSMGVVLDCPDVEPDAVEPARPLVRKNG